MVVLGIHKDPWHNTGAAIIREAPDGVRFANLSEERCNREKDSRKFPLRSVRSCMAELEIASVSEIDLVVLDYIVKPRWTEDWINRPCERSNFLGELNPSKIQVINHHLAHAYHVFYSSNF